MTEQEATELIATKLMGYRQSIEISPFTDQKLWFVDEFNAQCFNPFHDSNHARMVKDKIRDEGLCRQYSKSLIKRKFGDYRANFERDGITLHLGALFDINNAPDDVCMWAVVDVINSLVNEDK